MTNYYDILGVSRSASQEEIKAAFKSLSKKWHPDRFINKSEAEQKEAEAKFKEINEAYQVLSDPKKKSDYDHPGFGDFGFDPFGAFFGGFGRRQNAAPSGEACSLDIHVTLADLYASSKRFVEYDKKVRCPQCNGEGGTTHTCPTCNGTGICTKTEVHGNTIYQQQIRCTTCNGTGKVIDTKCDHCNGTGFISKKSTFDIDMDKLHLGANKAYSLGKYGHESRDPKGQDGDLTINIYFDYDHSRYAFSNNSLYEQIHIPYYDAIMGTTYDLALPDGKHIPVNIPSDSTNNNIIKLTGKGPFKKDYFLCVNVNYPKALPDDIALLKKIKENHDED